MDPKTEKCTFRGEVMYLADALMQLSKDELPEIEVTLEDGSVIRPYRFCKVEPDIQVFDGVTSI